MNASMLRVPASEVGDASDVAVALEVAGALWDKGDLEEAIRWVRRAGDAAGEAGDGERAASLARAAQALEDATRAPMVTSDATSAAMSMAASVATSVATSAASFTATDRAPAETPEAPPPAPPEARARDQNGGASAAHPAPAPSDGIRLRVSIKTSMRDPGLLLARRLPEGQPPPPGTREGFIVFPPPAGEDLASSNGSRSS